MKTVKSRSRLLIVILAVLITMGMMIPSIQVSYAEDQLDNATLEIKVDDKAPVKMRAYNASYKFNTYVSIRDLANVLKGTSKAFSFEQKEGERNGRTVQMMYIVKGGEYVPKGDENITNEQPQVDASLTNRNPLYVDGKMTKFYTYLAGEENEPFIKIVDADYILNIDIKYVDEHTLSVDTNEAFVPDAEKLQSEGYFSSLHGALVGDSKTGEIIFSYEPKINDPVAIASTTKLMTYLLVEEALDEGKISMDDRVTVSKAAEILYSSEDGVIPLEEGQVVSMQDLLEGMLVPSSNECALILAEHVAGSEEAFVKMMNDKAKELGLTTATFYNSHGLPDFTMSGVTSKRQNTMSAKDMFTLASYVVNNYPQILDITSKEEIVLPTMDNYEDTNTNPLLYNMDGVKGLKTGTTNRAGCNLIAYLPYTDSKGVVHPLIAVEFGAESSAERGEKTEMLLRIAMKNINDKNAEETKPEEPVPGDDHNNVNTGTGDDNTTVQPGDNNGNSTVTTDNSSKQTNKSEVVKSSKTAKPATGDSSEMLPYAVGLIAGLLGTVLIVLNRRSSKKHKF